MKQDTKRKLSVLRLSVISIDWKNQEGLKRWKNETFVCITFKMFDVITLGITAFNICNITKINVAYTILLKRIFYWLVLYPNKDVNTNIVKNKSNCSYNSQKMAKLYLSFFVSLYHLSYRIIIVFFISESF